MASPDLDDSIAVDLLTWVLYIGWLCILSGFAVLVGIEPLPTIQAWWPGWPGNVLAVAAGASFIGASKQLYDYLKQRWNPAPPPPAAAPPEPEGLPEEPTKKSRKKKRKSKKKKHR